MGTIFVGVVLLAVVGCIVRSIYKDKRAGKNPACGCNCSSCHGSCSTVKK